MKKITRLNSNMYRDHKPQAGFVISTVNTEIIKQLAKQIKTIHDSDDNESAQQQQQHHHHQEQDNQHQDKNKENNTTETLVDKKEKMTQIIELVSFDFSNDISTDYTQTTNKFIGGLEICTFPQKQIGYIFHHGMKVGMLQKTDGSKIAITSAKTTTKTIVFTDKNNKTHRIFHL